MADTNTTLSVPTAAFLAGLEQVTGHVLDVGCGSKPYKRLFPGCEWTGLDTRPVGEVEGDAHEIPFPNDTFDTVLCTEMLHLCVWPQIVVKEMARVLKPGGHLVVTVPNTSAEDNEALFNIKARGIDALVAMAKLKGVLIHGDGRLWTQEWHDYSRFNKYGVAQPKDFDGWIKQMDARYPSVTMAVAMKEPRDGDMVNGAGGDTG